jgi:hypothetical protein
MLFVHILFADKGQNQSQDDRDRECNYDWVNKGDDFAAFEEEWHSCCFVMC